MGEHRVAILYVAPWVTIGGSDRNTVDWFRAIDHARFAPYLVTTQDSPNELFDEAASHAERAWALPELMTGPAMPRFVADLVDRLRIGIVHVMNSRLGLELLPILRTTFPRLRSVVQLHAEEIGRSGYPKYVATRLDRWVDAYSVVSRYLADVLVGYGVDAAKIRVVHLGVDETVFDPERVEPEPLERGPGLQVLFPARLVEQKDPLLMVEVAARLRDAGSEAVVHVVGDGELAEPIRSAVAERGLADRVLLHGPRVDMPPWYAAGDVTLLTSRWEGVPLTVYESLAMQKPVVAPDVGAIGEVLTDDVGVLIEQRDDVDAYVEALLSLERAPERRERMGRAGRARVLEGFTIRRMIEGHEQLYEDLVAGAPKRRRRRADLSAFDDWWAEDTAPLVLCVTREPARAWLAAGHEPPRADVAVRVGRMFTDPFGGTEPLRNADGAPLGHVLRSPLPGMVELHEVLPGHLRGLWAAVSDGPPPPAPDLGPEPVWVDTPELLPEHAAD